MNLSRAFKYPFHNSAKVISIVLVMTIAFVVCIALIVNSADWSPYLETAYYGETASDVAPHDEINAGMFIGFLGLLAIVVFGGFWMNGYSAAAIGEVLNGNDTLPTIDFGANMRKGFWLFLSSLAYALLNIVVWIVVGVIAGVVGSIGSLFNILALLAFFAALILISIPSGWAYFIGIARYASDGDRGALFDIVRNMSIARQNAGTGVRLVLRFAALTIIYGIIQAIVEGLLGGLAGADIVVGAALTISIYFFFNLFNHFSTQHLIAQYALAVGVGQGGLDIDYIDKPK